MCIIEFNNRRGKSVEEKVILYDERRGNEPEVLENKNKESSTGFRIQRTKTKINNISHHISIIYEQQMW